MKFGKPLSFNLVDTVYRREGGRLIVETGIRARCQAIVRTMRDRELRGISDIREALDNRYKYGDLYCAARKLLKAGILRHNGYGRWQMVLRGEQIWNEICSAPRARVRRVG